MTGFAILSQIVMLKPSSTPRFAVNFLLLILWISSFLAQLIYPNRKATKKQIKQTYIHDVICLYLSTFLCIYKGLQNSFSIPKKCWN